MLKKTVLPVMLGMMMTMPIAAEPLHYNVVTLSSSARESVQRDTMMVTFSVQESGRERTQVSNAVTERSNRVLQRVRADKTLEGELSSRQAYPSYIDGNPKNAQIWQDEARITVRSKHFEALSRLIAAVQNDAAISHLGFTVSRDLQEKMQKNLTAAAIRNFREQAQNITRALGAGQYKIVTLNINSSNHGDGRMTKIHSTAEYAAAVPDTEAGSQDVQIQISGSIQVQ